LDARNVRAMGSINNEALREPASSSNRHATVKK
jgi:hypothetical protein